MGLPKFRAWDKEDEVMCEVDIIGFSEGAVTISNENVKYYHLGINEVELMQSTGLKDGSEVEIYEGDIVKFDARSHYHPEVYAWEYESKGVGVIRFEMGGYVLGGREESHILESLFGVLMNYEEIEMEVIGNIYENPELLEEEE